MTSIWKLIYDLEYWIQIGTGDDIVKCPGNRAEYQHAVKFLKARNTPPERIPNDVVVFLKRDARLPWIKRKTTWHLLILLINRTIKGLMPW